MMCLDCSIEWDIGTQQNREKVLKLLYILKYTVVYLCRGINPKQRTSAY